ncbi:MAG: phage tail protein [Bradymonadales bacterium]|nr:MAG: phage tail protein [Bradymonadales bacterium]
MSNPNSIIESFDVAQFEVNIEGLQAKNFTSIHGLGMNTESLPVQEGAMHEKVSRKGRTRYRNLELVRLFTGNKELVSWFQECARKAPVKRSGSVILKGENSEELFRFNFRKAWPIEWVGPSFEAHGVNQPAYERLVLDVEELEVV